MTVPVKERYFEDYQAGEVLEFGDHLVTEEEIIEFASKYDAQAFHIDPVAAKDSHFGGLVASGWMTGGILMSMLVEHFISPRASMGSPGIDSLRWLKPVRPGDRLRARVILQSSRKSRSKPDRGIVKAKQELLNQNDEIVMTVDTMGMYKTRNP